MGFRYRKSINLGGGFRINTPDASIGVCCSHKVIALGFNTLCYDAERRGIKPSARITTTRQTGGLHLAYKARVSS